MTRPDRFGICSLGRRYRDRARRLRDEGLFGYIRGQKGYVLVVVLLVVALLVSVSGEFLLTAQTNVHYARKFHERVAARSLSHTGLQMAVAILEADKRGIASGIMQGINSDTSTDSYFDLWALEFPEIPMENGFIGISIEDENAKINLSVMANEVVDQTPYYTITQRFFLNMGLPMDISDSLIDWVDIDDMHFPYGAESSDYYRNLNPPYSAKNAEMNSIGEMLLVKGITPEIYYGLGPVNERSGPTVEHNRGNTSVDIGNLGKDGKGRGFIRKESARTAVSPPIGRERSRRLDRYFRVYGERTDYLSQLNRININTASFRVLSSLSDDMTDDRVTEIIRRRQLKPFSSVDEVNDIITDETIRNNILTVRSFIFKIEATGRVNNTRVVTLTYYNREHKKYYYISEY
ncbi:MAG TPA: general secretion pathway protein GspK [Spirochaetes bacterium]|nr:general secretion pathway protein GspK [Spirochaetota bacterium]